MPQLFELPASVMLPTEDESRRVPMLVTMALSASHVGFACLRLRTGAAARAAALRLLRPRPGQERARLAPRHDDLGC